MKIPTIIGHRGAPEAALENTEASIRAALKAGAEIIETDVRLTADGHIVLCHDTDFSRLGGPKIPIRRMTRAEIERLKTPKALFMDRALRLFPEVYFNVDLKDRGRAIVQAWSGLLERSGASLRCRTASFHDSVLRRFRRLNPGKAVSVARFAVLRILIRTLLGVPRSPRKSEAVLQIPEKAGFFRIVTPHRIAVWQRLGWEIHVWTVDSQDDMKRLANWGVDGLITNRPSLAKETLR